jgi:hypothetical protein
MGLMECDQWGGFRDSRERGGVSIMQDGAGDMQNGTGVEGNWLRASKATTPSKDFLHWKIHILKLLYIVQYCIGTVYFSPLQVKNTPHECIMNVYRMAMNNYYLVVCCVICSYSLAEKMLL